MIEQAVICGLAGWRVASLLVDEAGPGDVFTRLRAWAGSPDVGELQDTPLAKLFECVWCMSVWTAAAFWILWYVHWAIPGVFAAMAVAIVVNQWAWRPKP